MYVRESGNNHYPSITQPHSSSNSVPSTKPFTMYQAKQPGKNMIWKLPSKVSDPHTFNHNALW